ncbi:MAG: DUF1634 domain-containing protein [Elusimicrobia bacterium]|nr:DUF1634 domain-containing protein [Elusimicrobiota bacterium]
MARLDGGRREEGRFAGAVLAAGIRVSALLMAAGLLLRAWRPQPWPQGVPHWGAILRSAAGGHGEALALLGIAVLIATPYVRVATLCAAFARGRQWRLLAVSAAVLGLLLAGLLSVQSS